MHVGGIPVLFRQVPRGLGWKRHPVPRAGNGRLQIHRCSCLWKQPRVRGSCWQSCYLGRRRPAPGRPRRLPKMTPDEPGARRRLGCSWVGEHAGPSLCCASLTPALPASRLLRPSRPPSESPLRALCLLSLSLRLHVLRMAPKLRAPSLSLSQSLRLPLRLCLSLSISPCPPPLPCPGTTGELGALAPEPSFIRGGGWAGWAGSRR